jgi:hypothetical protein
VRPSSPAVGLPFRVCQAFGRISLVGFTPHDLGLANWSPGCSRMPFGAVRNAPYRPLVGLGSASEYDPKQAADEQHPLMRSGCPSTHEATGSDQRRVCLTRLRYAFRLSQPLGVSFLPRPVRLCFTPVASLGFSLQRFAPLTSPPEPLGLTAPPDVVPTEPAETRSLAWTMVAHGRMRNGPLFRGCGHALAPGTRPAP